ncbi:MAG: glycine cleavage T C-terminal barrel domain-containing protein, partial [Acidimicrobiales bacterium]
AVGDPGFQYRLIAVPLNTTTPSVALVAIPLADLDAVLQHLVGVDLLGAPADPPLVPAGDPGAFVVQRIVAGIPEPVSELTDQTIPFEAGIVAETTSFTKGCYTGQELIARLDARGAKVPRRLRGVLVEADRPDERVAAGTALLVEGREVGRLTSVAFSPQRAAIVALAYVARGVEPPAEALLSP